MVTGYLHPDYAASLAEFGTPRELPHCRGWILERAIPGFPDRDAMGCYPLFACEDWSQLHRDLDEIGDGLVSLALVADPFGDYDEADLRRCFRDVVIPFKEHFVADLRRPVNAAVSKDHRKKARRALREVRVETCREPAKFIADWMALYTTLTERHKIMGIRAFSRAAFLRQLSIPGLVMFRAVYQGDTVGATLWFVQGPVGYGHLAAFDRAGYRLDASYALDWSAIEFFSGQVRWLDFGAGAGMSSGGTDGLSRYKRGWTSETRTAFFCGRILDHARYSVIVTAKDVPATDYFPAYRKGEFG